MPPTFAPPGTVFKLSGGAGALRKQFDPGTAAGVDLRKEGRKEVFDVLGGPPEALLVVG
jgi:hypothetical protein